MLYQLSYYRMGFLFKTAQSYVKWRIFANFAAKKCIFCTEKDG